MVSVTVQMFRADDGSLHQTEGEANWKNEYMRKNRQVEIVVDAIRDDVIDFLRFYGKRYDNLDDYDVRVRIEEIAKICLKHSSKIQSGANKR